MIVAIFLFQGLDNIHTNLVDSVPFRGSTASISSDPMNPMPKLSTTNASNATPMSSSVIGGDPFGDSFDPFDGGASTSSQSHSQIPTTTFSTASLRYALKSGLSDPSPLSLMGNSHHQLGQPQSAPYSSTTTPLTFTSDPFAQIDPFPGPKYHGEGDFFNSDPFDSPSGQFSFAYPNNDPANKRTVPGNVTVGEKMDGSSQETHPSSRSGNDAENVASSATRSAAYRERHADGWVASFEDVSLFSPKVECKLLS